MEKQDRKKHWENVYRTKERHQVGWYQPVPATSLKLIDQLNLQKDARVIDVGGGDSALADHLLARGFNDVTVVDISSAAINRARNRLGNHTASVNWITQDIIDLRLERQYDLWHDRAVFHFLTTHEEVKKYVQTVSRAVRPNGYFIIGTFSDTGPSRCSGLQITRYSIKMLTEAFAGAFHKVRCISPDHITPGGVVQHYTFCCFQRIAI